MCWAHGSEVRFYILQTFEYSRKEGNQVLYSLRDPLLIKVLDAMRKYFQHHFEDSIEMLRRMEQRR